MSTPDAQPHFIEIEIGSFCNRTCAWCGNGWDLRGRKKNYIHQPVWEKIIYDLSRKNYSGWLAFHNYNEPLADPTIYDKVSFVNAKLPGAKTAIYTNGDYLNETTIAKLLKLDVREIRVTLYPANADIFVEQPDEKMHTFIANLKLKDIQATVESGKRGREARFKVANSTFHVILPNIKSYTDRAGTVKIGELRLPSRRQTPCFLPTHSAAIDYKGNLKLCCQIYDVEADGNLEFNIGNVYETDFWELWDSEKMKVFRLNALSAKFDSMGSCQFCTHSISDEQLENLKLTI